MCLFLLHESVFFITNLIRKKTGIVEKTGAIIGAIALLILKKCTKANIIPIFKPYSKAYTMKVNIYFFKVSNRFLFNYKGLLF